MTKISLPTKIVLIMAFVILSIGYITAKQVTKYAEEVLIKRRKSEISAANSGQAQEISQILDNSRLFVKMIALNTRITEYFTQPTVTKHNELVDIFDEYKRDDNQYESLYLLDKNGKVLISTDRLAIGQDYSFHEYFKKAINGEAAAEALIGVTNANLGYYFSHPVKTKNNQPIGAVVAKLEPGHINRSLVNTKVNREGNLMLADAYGVILYSNKQERIYRSMGKLNQAEQQKIGTEQRFPGKKIIPLDYGSVQEIIRNYQESKTIEFYDLAKKEDEMVSISKTGDFPFYLVLEVGLPDVAGTANEISNILAIGMFSSSIIATIILLIIISGFLRPLSIFKNLSNKVSQGDFSQRINLANNDELGDLARTFNDMTEHIQDIYKNLEQKVQEKTNDLSIKISELEKTKKAMFNLLEDLNIEKTKINEARVKDDAILSSVGDSLIAVDYKGMIMTVNKQAEIMLDLKADEVIGKSYLDYIRLADKDGRIIPNDQRPIYKTLSTGTRIIDNSYFYTKKDGTKFAVSITATPILLVGKAIGAIDVIRDITKEKEVDRMKTEFISLASHQLRTPLSAIKWYIEMLLNGDVGKLTVDQEQFIKNVEESSERMISLVNSLLNISRIESGRIIIDPQPTDLNELLIGVIKELEVKFFEKKINPTVNVEPNLPKINIDPKLIRNVYINLLTNAIKYTPEKGNIAISLTKKDEQIISQISDNGYGIPKREQHKIFKRFFRAENIVKLETEGTGLGLYLVKAIIESSSGRIWYESEESKGTTFWFSLPVSGSLAKKGDVTLDS